MAEAGNVGAPRLGSVARASRNRARPWPAVEGPRVALAQESRWASDAHALFLLLREDPK